MKCRCVVASIILALFLPGIRLSAQNFSPAKPIVAKGIENLFQLTPRIYSGSTPEGDEGFAQLQSLGVKTIVSVDGSRPDIELAHKYGLRYVHLPHSYDGIGASIQAELIKAARATTDPIFVHCHHGKHRGPTAAAVICMANYGWTPAQAETWLQTAGTATNYAGLYATVRDFHPPSAAVLAKVPASFPEVAKVSGLVDAMVSIDGHWDLLNAVRKAEYRTPKDHPDLVPASEAVILWEHFRESQRMPESVRRGAGFVERLQGAEATVKEMELLFRRYSSAPGPALRAELDRRFDTLNQSCVTCHKENRDAVIKVVK